MYDPHFPFSRPPGSPLHWAVTASNTAAVIALLRMGAKTDMRNGDDPYVHDLNVREMNLIGDNGENLMSAPASSVQGLSILDFATANHDWEMLRAIHSVKGGLTSVSNFDEEGYSAFHRLSHHRVPSSYTGWFWYPAFAGSSSRRTLGIYRTIETLKIMGGQIDGLTQLTSEEKYNSVSPGNLTPLMLAVTKGDIDVVRELLRSGANPDIVNERGFTAFTLLPEDGNPLIVRGAASEIALSLLKHGASPTHVPTSRNSPLQTAISVIIVRVLEVVEALLRAGADPVTKIGGVNIFALVLAEKRYSHFDHSDDIDQFQKKFIALIKDSGLTSHSCHILEKVDDCQGSCASLRLFIRPTSRR